MKTSIIQNDVNYILSPIEDGEDIICSGFKVNLKSNKQILSFSDGEGNNYWIQSVLEGGKDTFRTIKNSKGLNWDSVFTDVDLKEEIIGKKVKEYIIVKNNQAKKDFKFVLTVSDNIEYQLIDNEVIFKSKLTNNEIAKIDIPVVKDNKGTEIQYNYRLVANELYLETIEDLNKFEFPIVIDPTYEITGTGSTASHYHTLARQSNGNLFVVTTRVSGSFSTIYYCKSTDRGQTWGSSIMITAPSGYTNFSPQICTDSNNNLHVVFLGKTSATSSTNQIRYISATSDEVWGTAENITYLAAESGYGCQRPIMIPDSNNKLHTVYSSRVSAGGTNDSIRYVSGNAGNWSDIEEISRSINELSAKNHTVPVIAIDSNNMQHIVWGGQTEYLSFDNILHVSGTKGNRSLLYVTSTANHQSSPYICEDSSNNMHLTWKGRTSASNNKYILQYSKFTYSTSTWGGLYYIYETSSYDQDVSMISRNKYDDLDVIWRGKASAFGANNGIRYTRYTNATSSWGNDAEITNTSSFNYLNLGIINFLNPANVNTPVSGLGAAFVSASGSFVYWTTTDYSFGDEPATGQFMSLNSKYW